MKIIKKKKKSWHYKLVKWWGMKHSQSLCVYFWQVVASLTVVPLLVLSVILLGVVLFITVITGIIVFPSVLLGVLSTETEELLFFTFVGGLSWTVIFSVLYVLYSNRVKHKQPSLIFSYIKAKKDKVCPIIEFEDK